MKEYELIAVTEGNQLINLGYHQVDDIGKVAPVRLNGKKIDIKFWGADNQLPYYREKQIMDNNIVGELIDTKAQFIVGNGIKPFKERYEDGKKIIEPVAMPAEIEDWYEDVDFNQILLTAARDDQMHANSFIEYQQTLGGKITEVRCKRIKNIRLQKKGNDGMIKNAFYHPSWTQSTSKFSTIKLYKKGIKGNFGVFQKNDFFDDGYYGHPVYWGGKNWIILSNIIPKFHIANLEHGYTIRYHIKIPKNYFLDKEKFDSHESEEDKKKCIDEATALRKAFVNKVNQFLAGVKNTGRALFTTYDFDMSIGKEYPGVKIESINTDMKDQALLALYEKSNQANISGQGLHPTLANIETQGKLASGSEILNAYNYYQGAKTRGPRRRMSKYWKVVMEIHGWREKYKGLKWGFESVELKKLDENKMGKQEKIE